MIRNEGLRNDRNQSWRFEGVGPARHFLDALLVLEGGRKMGKSALQRRVFRKMEGERWPVRITRLMSTRRWRASPAC
jgi:hypothetical protein